MPKKTYITDELPRFNGDSATPSRGMLHLAKWKCGFWP